MDIKEINREIEALERGQTTFANCEKLSQLYIVRDGLMSDGETMPREASPELGGSEFLELSSGVDIISLLRIIDEHMESLQLVYPKEYKHIIKKISALK